MTDRTQFTPAELRHLRVVRELTECRRDAIYRVAESFRKLDARDLGHVVEEAPPPKRPRLELVINNEPQP
jgi:hypothetical protein